MKRRKSTDDATAASIEHACDLPTCECHCDELAPAIEELTRQIHLLGVIIDELVSEFQWQNNQMAQHIRQGDNATETLQPSDTTAVEPVQSHRTTLFE